MDKVLNNKKLFFDPGFRPVPPPRARDGGAAGKRNEQPDPKARSASVKFRSGLPAPSFTGPSFLDNQVLDRKRTRSAAGENASPPPNSKTKQEKSKSASGTNVKYRTWLTAAGAALLVALVSLMAIGIQVQSFFWEKNRDPAVESRLVYQKLLLERAVPEAELDGAGSGGFALPTLTVRTYEVRKGDSLFGIARQFNVSVDTLISANSIDNAYYLQAGADLEIPSVSGVYHTVAKGENLSLIAASYDVSVNDIADLNDLPSETLYVGQLLFVPGASLSDWERALALGELFLKPLNGRITSGMGFRRDPFTGMRAWHAGLDIANSRGTKVKAAQQGRVIYAGYKGNYGRVVEISHPNGYRTLYAHLDRIVVKRGQTVRQGQHIGNVGNTGRSTGPHLHLEIHRYGKLLDPLKLIRW
jgi:murein DD-endopeptidase MepM/ murein hydrolase activator NlpD